MLSSNSRRQALRAAARSGGMRRASGRCKALPRQSAQRISSVLPRAQFYSTEKILQLRTGQKGATSEALPKTLYRADGEKENCGVGLIASLKSVPSNKIVREADEMLCRMTHRGGVGSDPNSGDGSGTCQPCCFVVRSCQVPTKNAFE